MDARRRRAQRAAHERPRAPRRLVRPLHHALPRGRRSAGAATPRPRASNSNGTWRQGAPLPRHPWSRAGVAHAPARAARLFVERPGLRDARAATRRRWPRADAARRRRDTPASSQAGRDAVFSLLRGRALPTVDRRGRVTAMDSEPSQPFRVEAVDYEAALDRPARGARDGVRRGAAGAARTGMGRARPAVRARARARRSTARPIGTGRLTPEHKIGRMAVLREWRGQRRRRCAAAAR